jgi:DNA polymerase-3 subunit gamma/tau
MVALPGGGGARPAPASPAAGGTEAAVPAAADPRSYKAVAELARDRREARLAKHLTHDVRLVQFEPGRIELNPGPEAPRDLAGRLGRALQTWTGRRWVVSVSDRPGEPTLHEQLHASVLADPLVRAVLDAFPGATIGRVRERAAAATADTAAAGGGPGADNGVEGDDGEAGPAADFMIESDDDAPAFGALDDGFGDDDR